jgi:hypothetical protein
VAKLITNVSIQTTECPRKDWVDLVKIASQVSIKKISRKYPTKINLNSSSRLSVEIKLYFSLKLNLKKFVMNNIQYVPGLSLQEEKNFYF